MSAEPSAPPVSKPSQQYYAAVPSIGSGRYILVGACLLLVIGFGAIVESLGGTINIKSNAMGAAVRVDGRIGSPQGDSVQFVKVPFGNRQVSISHIDYEPFETLVSNGWFSRADFSFQLRLRPVTIVVLTA